jgi:hypothetical protein
MSLYSRALLAPCQTEKFQGVRQSFMGSACITFLKKEKQKVKILCKMTSQIVNAGVFLTKN